MFFVKEPSALDSPWILSHCKDKQVVAISKDTTKDLKNHHILGIDFLYQNYRKQFKGAILNEEDEMNMCLQVAAFLNAMFNSVEQKFLVLIISPDNLVVNWHYHLRMHGGLKVQIVTSNTCPEDFDQEHGLALILPFSNIRLADYLIDYNYFSVVIDNFDEIASKLVIRKLDGNFNIGLTKRSFYTHPNQKLQWTMLNWSNPGCVGKLADFYEVDNDNFANFRDNYRHWWFRLTWNFCESFSEITFAEKQEYTKSIAKWALANNLSNFPCVGTGKKVKKRKKIEIIKDTTDDSKGDQKNKVTNSVEPTRKVYNKDSIKGGPQEIVYCNKIKEENEDELTDAGEAKDESSGNTIIYEVTHMQAKVRDPNYVDLPSMDENPILNSIIKNFEKSSESVAAHNSFTRTKHDLDQSNCSKAFEDDDVLMSIIDNTNTSPTPPPLDHEAQMSYKKEVLFSQIFNDAPCTSKSFLQTEDDNEFFLSLVESDNNVKVKKRSSIKQSRSDDIDDILKETEVLLRE